MPNEPHCKAYIRLPRAAAERIAAALSELYWPEPEAIGLFTHDERNWDVEITFRGRPDKDALVNFLKDHDVEDFTLSFKEIPDLDWVSMSQAVLHPVRAGRFLVHGGHDRAQAHGSCWAIEIDAGQAFGTAHHGSTTGCLMALDDLAKRERVQKVLDIGTGTGVLAIAAARVWNASVFATEIDPVAAEIAERNAELNAVRSHVRVITADGLKHPLIRAQSPYDLITANILAVPLVAMAHSIARALRRGGIVVLSGITREQARRVAAAYGAAGLTRLHCYEVSEWVTLTLRRVG